MLELKTIDGVGDAWVIDGAEAVLARDDPGGAYIAAQPLEPLDYRLFGSLNMRLATEEEAKAFVLSRTAPAAMIEPTADPELEPAVEVIPKKSRG